MGPTNSFCCGGKPKDPIADMKIQQANVTRQIIQLERETKTLERKNSKTYDEVKRL